MLCCWFWLWLGCMSGWFVSFCPVVFLLRISFLLGHLLARVLREPLQLRHFLVIFLESLQVRYFLCVLPPLLSSEETSNSSHKAIGSTRPRNKNPDFPKKTEGEAKTDKREDD